jgi:hypothetical protein
MKQISFAMDSQGFKMEHMLKAKLQQSHETHFMIKGGAKVELLENTTQKKVDAVHFPPHSHTTIILACSWHLQSHRKKSVILEEQKPPIPSQEQKT